MKQVPDITLDNHCCEKRKSTQKTFYLYFVTIFAIYPVRLQDNVISFNKILIYATIQILCRPITNRNEVIR
jgi:hypothetical protein